VELKAKIKDIANTPDAGTDTAVGDIRMARVSFVNRGTGATLATVNVVVDPEDPNNGLATYSWNVNIGANQSQAFQIGFIVSHYYTRNNTTENATITVFK